jgi:acylphosphatase
MIHNAHNRIHLVATGRVQGVGFRWFVYTEARRLDLAGWVRNNPDGSVELEAEGEAASLQRLRERVQKGPPAARVDRVVELPPSGASLSRPFGTG